MNNSVAPYNFVSLPEKAVAPYTLEELPMHDLLNDELISGYLEYTIKAETPIIISKGTEKEGLRSKAEFFKNAKGEYTIPGSTLRGLLRSNVSILSLSNVTDDITNSRFYFRSFDSSSLRKQYSDRLGIVSKTDENGKTYSKVEGVKGGYIYKESKDNYVIIPAKEIQGETYFRISEIKLRKLKTDAKINYMYNEKILEFESWVKKQYGKDKGEELLQRKKGSLLNQYDREVGVRNRRFIPYCEKIGFTLSTSNKRSINGIYGNKEGKNKGYILCSSFISGNLAHFIINEYDESSDNKIYLNKENNNIQFIDYYEDDLIRTKKKSPVKEEQQKNKEKHEFYYLPEENGIKNGKPIFYGEYNGKIYLGFSPYFRIPYDYSIHNGISALYKDEKAISYAEALFGFSNKIVITKDNSEKVSYKSRVRVQDATVINIPKTTEKHELILSEPAASSVQTYLKQKSDNVKELITYNTEDFRIGGIKNYWLKRYIDKSDPNITNESVKINVYPLPRGTTFKGKIRFSNLKKEELGLLLWSLKIDEDTYYNIGLGKPYGLGRISINVENVKVEDLSKKYSSLSVEEYYNDISKEEYIKYYKQYFQKNYNIEDLDNTQTIKEFITMKSIVVDNEDKDNFRYMSLKEFSGRKPLLDVLKTLSLIKNPKTKAIVNAVIKTNSKDVKGDKKIESTLKDNKHQESSGVDNKGKEIQKIVETKKCTACGKEFSINEKQREFLKKVGKPLPQKCLECR